MNYRHAFHAGNFADCMKHALLVWLLRALQRKPAAMQVLDTHAGIGDYDLDASEAARTGEWRDGIGRLREGVPPEPLADYLVVAGPAPHYPGSPAIVQRLLRPQDRLLCCELHPDDAATLRRRFSRVPEVAVHHRDGYEALGALLPPPARRGLTLIDPPFERPDEFMRLAEGIAIAQRRFATGVLAAWYPIKHRAPVRDFHDRLRAEAPNGHGLRDMVCAELLLRAPLDPGRLNGAGLLVVNPPYGFEAAAETILNVLLDRLGNGAPGQAARVERLAAE